VIQLIRLHKTRRIPPGTIHTVTLPTPNRANKAIALFRMTALARRSWVSEFMFTLVTICSAMSTIARLPKLWLGQIHRSASKPLVQPSWQCGRTPCSRTVAETVVLLLMRRPKVLKLRRGDGIDGDSIYPFVSASYPNSTFLHVAPHCLSVATSVARCQ
jgi:hypothetical protein